MNLDAALNVDGRRFLTDRHLATLSTIAPDGSLHVVAVGFTVADGVVRIITGDGTQKVRNVERDGRATVAQVEGAQWVSIGGVATIERDPAAVARAVELYAARYRQPRVNPQRVVIRIEPHKLLASSGLRSKGVNA
jgi:PPOX class probable F420-dependent enzyme